MDFMANLALIISAAGMVALAILTHRSVRVMEKSVNTIQKDSLLETRPFVHVDTKAFRLGAQEEVLELQSRLLNVGVSPALLEIFEVSYLFQFEMILMYWAESVGAHPRVRPFCACRIRRTDTRVCPYSLISNRNRYH